MKRQRMNVKTAAVVICGCVLAAQGCENETEIRYVANLVPLTRGTAISTAEQFASIGRDADYPANGEYYLTDDIDLSPLWVVEEGEKAYVWRSIGSTCPGCDGPLLPTVAGSPAGLQHHALPLRCNNSSCLLNGEPQQPFSGILHGNGKTISGLRLPNKMNTGDYKEAIYFGLFGYINDAVIENVTVTVANTAEDPDTDNPDRAGRAAYAGTATSAVQPSFGVLAGYARNSTIANVFIKADSAESGLYVTSPVSSTNASNYIGGVVGNGLDASITDAASSVALDVDGKGYDCVGGIAGALTSGKIRGANVTGNITADSTGTYLVVAGISTIASQIRDCAVTMGAISLTVAATTGNPLLALAGIGYGSDAVTDCAVSIDNICVVSNDTSNARQYYVGGISASTVSPGGSSYAGISSLMERNNVTFETLSVTLNESAQNQTTYIGGIAGYRNASAAVSNCTVTGKTLTAPLNGTYPAYIGGITGSGPVSDSSVTNLAITVKTSGTGYLYVGGIAGLGAVSNSSSEKQSICAEKTGATNPFYVGGITGYGNVSNSGVTDQSITVKTATTGLVYAGGITGSGIVNRSFTGTAAEHTTLKVTKTDTTSASTANYAYVGGISGQTAPTTAFQFENNYAFCNVTLVSAGITGQATLNTGNQSVGGLVGYFSGTATDTFVRHSFAAGSVTFTSNYSSGGTLNAGGIAGYKNTSTNPKIQACAALNSAITINGENSSATRNVKRIANIGTASSVLVNNIAGSSINITPSGEPTSAADGADGLTVTEITEDTFFGTESGQLGWSRDVWEWDAASGYPVFKPGITP